MTKKANWTDDYWLLLMQQYLRKPVGIKPTYCREMVELSLELHIPPKDLHTRMCQIATLETPRIERLWETYKDNPRRLSRASRLLREMKGFGQASSFYDGVEVNETFELDFRPITEDARITPIMLVMVLDLYFQLTPATMVPETPEVTELSRLIRLPVGDIVELLDVFQHCDPYLNRRDTIFSPLLGPCQKIWDRYGNDGPEAVASYANELRAFFEH